MKLLPHWVLTEKSPAFYDTESATAIQQTAKVYAAMQELIKEYNAFADRVNVEILEWQSSVMGDIEIFSTSIRQEFQDFINVVDLTIQEQDQKLEQFVASGFQELVLSELEKYRAELSNEIDTKLDEKIVEVDEQVANKLAEVDSLVASKLAEFDSMKTEFETLKTNLESESKTYIDGQIETKTDELKVYLDELVNGVLEGEY